MGIATSSDRFGQLYTNELEELIAVGPAVIYAAEPSLDCGPTFVSPNVEALLGYDAASCLGDHKFWINNIHPDDASRIVGQLSSLHGQDRHILEYRFRHADGSWLWLRDELNLVRDAAGKPQKVVGYLSDITERIHARQALEESRQRFRDFAEASSDWFWETDEELSTAE